MSRSPRVLRRRLGILAAALVVGTAAWIGFYFAVRTYTVQRTFRYRLTADSPLVDLAFPSGASPRLVSYALINVGDAPMRTPRLLVDDAPRLWSIAEIIGSCGSRDQSPDRLAICLFHLLRRLTPHGSDALLARWGDSNEVLVAVNYRGFSQCGSISIYLGQLAQAMGWDVRRLDFGQLHTMAELKWNGAWHLFDTDRGFYWTDSDYGRLLSFDDLRRNPDLFLGSPPGEDNVLYDHNRNALKEPLRYGVIPPAIDDLPLRHALLPAGARLEFFAAVDETPQPTHASLIVPVRNIVDVALELPYPLWRVRIESPNPLTVRDPDRQKSAVARDGRPALLDYLDEPIPWQPARRRLHLNLEAPPERVNAVLQADMRVAPGALPALHEGVNRLSVDAAPSMWTVDVELTVALTRGRFSLK